MFRFIFPMNDFPLQLVIKIIFFRKCFIYCALSRGYYTLKYRLYKLHKIYIVTLKYKNVDSFYFNKFVDA